MRSEERHVCSREKLLNDFQSVFATQVLDLQENECPCVTVIGGDLYIKVVGAVVVQHYDQIASACLGLNARTE